MVSEAYPILKDIGEFHNLIGSDRHRSDTSSPTNNTDERQK